VGAPPLLLLLGEQERVEGPGIAAAVAEDVEVEITSG
jgi:hypothetical protein